VAGFVAGYLLSDGDMEQAFRMGQAAGSASAFSSNLATKEEVDALLQNL
jgi:1-phosphofructokinase